MFAQQLLLRRSERVGISSMRVFYGFFTQYTWVCVRVCVHNTCIGSRNQGLKWATTSARTLDSSAYLPWRLAPSRVFFSGFQLHEETPQHVPEQIFVQIFALQRSPFWPATWQKIKKKTENTRKSKNTKNCKPNLAAKIPATHLLN